MSAQHRLMSTMLADVVRIGRAGDNYSSLLQGVLWTGRGSVPCRHTECVPPHRSCRPTSKDGCAILGKHLCKLIMRRPWQASCFGRLGRGAKWQVRCVACQVPLAPPFRDHAAPESNKTLCSDVVSPNKGDAANTFKSIERYHLLFYSHCLQ